MFLLLISSSVTTRAVYPEESREGRNERKSARENGRVREARLKISPSLKLTFMREECDRVIEKREANGRKVGL